MEDISGMDFGLSIVSVVVPALIDLINSVMALIADNKKVFKEVLLFYFRFDSKNYTRIFFRKINFLEVGRFGTHSERDRDGHHSSSEERMEGSGRR